MLIALCAAGIYITGMICVMNDFQIPGFILLCLGFTVLNFADIKSKREREDAQR